MATPLPLSAFDFYNELNKSDDDDCDRNDNENVPRCLISDEPLTERAVTMPCGHAFNYLPLLKDAFTHKHYYNRGESRNGRLNMNELRCPYCRAKHAMFLPYYSDDPQIPKIVYVNWYDPNLLYKSPHKKGDMCVFQKTNHDFDPSKPVGADNYPTYRCCQPFAEPIQQMTKKGMVTYGDTNSYCPLHMHVMIDHHKANALEERKKNTFACEAILKSGARKGQPCGCLVFKETLCGKHREKPCPPPKTNIPKTSI